MVAVRVEDLPGGQSSDEFQWMLPYINHPVGFWSAVSCAITVVLLSIIWVVTTAERERQRMKRKNKRTLREREQIGVSPNGGLKRSQSFNSFHSVVPLHRPQDEDEDDGQDWSWRDTSDEKRHSDQHSFLKSIKIFSTLPEAVFGELCTHLVPVSLKKGEVLFTEATSDENLYVIMKGRIQVFVTEANGSENLLTEVVSGEAVTSLLSLLAVLVGENMNLQATARVVEDTELVKLSTGAFGAIAKKFPHAAVNIVHMVMTRLERVTFLTMIHYLGLTTELVTHDAETSKAFTKINDDKALKERCIDAMESMLGVSNGAITREDVVGSLSQVLKYEAGQVVVEKGSATNPCFHFVVAGELTVKINDTRVYSVHPGDGVGHLVLLTGESSRFTVEASVDSKVIALPKRYYDKFVAKDPLVLIHTAKSLIRRLSPVVLQLDFALEWVRMEAGETLFRQGDDPDSLFIVINGRLRSFTEANGSRTVLGEYGRGDSVGEVEVLTGTQRSLSVKAVRDTEVAKIPVALFRLISLKYPQVVLHFGKVIGTRLLDSMGGSKREKHGHHRGNAMHPLDHDFAHEDLVNLATIAIIPASEDVPLTLFAERLSKCLNKVGPTIHLNSFTVADALGRSSSRNFGDIKMVTWLGEMEEKHRVVLYEADHQPTKWTRRCIRQADCILVVANADASPAAGAIEKKLLDSRESTARKEIVLLHRSRFDEFDRTELWLQERPQFAAHHHVHLHDDEYYDVSHYKSDVARVARRLTGTSIGVVLGGGGARGLSHIGILKALEEAGVPVDMIGGTSIGSFIGGLYASSPDSVSILPKARFFSKGMSSVWNKIVDLTYPATSMFSGAMFNKSIEEIFGFKRIEDLWLPYFAVSTNISGNCLGIHRQGTLWKFVRASMSLAGYLPPICDNGQLLLDGGYLNNLPVDVMRNLGARTVIAIDVGGVDEGEYTDYGDSLSGWWVLLNKYNPFAKKMKIPSMNDVQDRLAFVSSELHFRRVREKVDLYLRPPVNNYATLEFNKFEEIEKIGYDFGKEQIDKYLQANTIPGLSTVRPSQRSSSIDQGDDGDPLFPYPARPRRRSLPLDQTGDSIITT